MKDSENKKMKENLGGKKREEMDHKLREHGVRWPRRIKFTISFTTNKSSSHNLKTKEKKKFSL